MRSSCFGFSFDSFRLLKKKFVSCVSTCFTAMLHCFKWFRQFRFVLALSRVVHVASDRFKVFFVFGCFGWSRGCVGGSNCFNLFYVIFVCFEVVQTVLGCFGVI